ncbi:MAG: hypothetical protein RMJ87_08485 [Cytophagales bacterium]|nr:hypothetical protein [Cytophagales bacterium]
MAHIRLRINNKEYEIEGSEEFISRMEPKLTELLEKYLAESAYATNEFSNGQVSTKPPILSNVEPVNQPIDDSYVKEFLERYNRFNELVRDKK